MEEIDNQILNTKETLFYYLPGDREKHMIEVEWDETGKSKKMRCFLSPSPYDDFLIDKHSLLGECGDPFCRRTLQFFREPVRPGTLPGSEVKASEVKESMKVSKTGKEGNKKRGTSSLSLHPGQPDGKENYLSVG